MKIKNTALLLLVIFILGMFPTTAFAAVENPFESIAATDYDTSDMPDKFQRKSGFVAMNKRDHNSYICFKSVDFTASPYAVVVNTATSTDYITNNTYEFRLDSPKGELLSTVYVTDCASWGNPVENIGTINTAVTGIHDLYISTNQPNDFYNFYFMVKIEGEFPYVPYSTYTPFYDVAGNSHEYEINSLFSLGIIEGTTESEYTPLLPVTRKEYAKWLVRLMTDEVPETTTQIFSDVDMSTDGFNEIAYLYENGILSLNSEKTYKPWSFITIRDAAVMALRLLGYDALCQNKGGYPTGYDKVARDLKLYEKNVSSDILRRDVAASLLYNVIKAKTLEITGIENKEPVYSEKGDGILYQSRNIKYGEGVVRAGTYGGLTGDITMPVGSCYIGTTLFKLGDVNLESLLGVKCEFFYKETDNGQTKTLLSVLPSRKTKQKIFETNKGKEITELSATKLSYEDEKGKTTKIPIPTTAMWIYNNRAMTRSISTVIPDISKFKGTIRLVDNGSGNYDTVVIENYITVKLQSMDSDNNSFYDELGQKAYSFKNKKLLLSDGTQTISPKKVKKGQIAELYISDDEEIAVLLFGETTIKGIAEEHNTRDNTLRIGSYYYYTANEFDVNELVLGATAEYVLNRHNEIVYVNNNNVKSVGILRDFKKENNKIYIRIITATGKTEDFQTAEKFWIDGVKVSEFDEVRNGKGAFVGLMAVGQDTVCLYNINEDGLLTVLDTVKDGANDEKDTLREILAYNSSKSYYYRRSSAIFTSEGSFVSDQTYPAKKDSTVIALDLTDTEGGTYIGSITKYSDTEAKPVALYSTDGKNIADIVLNKGGSIGTFGYGFFDSYSYVADKHGEVGLSVTLKKTAGTETYFVSPENTTVLENVKKLKKGDCIIFHKNASGNVEKFGIGYLCPRNPGESSPTGLTAIVSSSSGLYGNKELNSNFVFGTVEAIEDNYIKVIPAGKSFPFWCYAENAGTVKISSDGNIKNGLNSNVIKPGDNVLIHYNYSLSWIAVYE